MERRYWILTGIQILAVAVLIRFLITSHTPWNVERYIGTALVIVGVTCIVIARFQLGRSFSITPQARQLVTTGLYSRIRNPIYVFGTVTIVGLTLILQKPDLWIIVVVLVIGQAIRARREADVLEAAFGDAYREYRRKTWF